MTISLYARRRNLGLAGGCLWLIFVGTVYAAWSLLTVRSGLATWLLAAESIAAIALILFGVAMIRGLAMATGVRIVHLRFRVETKDRSDDPTDQPGAK